VRIPNLADTNASKTTKGAGQSPTTNRAFLRSAGCLAAEPPGHLAALASQKNGRMRRFVGFALAISGAGNVLYFAFCVKPLPSIGGRREEAYPTADAH
jgi:hypothetical protein